MQRIVIIDDSAVVRDAAVAALRAAGFEVVALHEPSRAAFDPRDPPDLVLLDVVLVHAFGDDAARYLRNAWGVTAPVYLYSSLPEEELRQRAAAAGAAGYICKAWGLEELVARVRQALPGAAGLAFAETRQLPATRPDPGPDPGPASASAGVFAIFVREAAEHAAAITGALDSATDDADVLAIAERELHGWLGDARLLQLERLGETLLALHRRLRAWPGEFSRAQHGPQLRRWIVRLQHISEQLTQHAPSLSLGRELRELRAAIASDVAAVQAAATGERATSGRSVLFFDDSPIIGDVIRQELGARGHRVLLAQTLAEFEEHLLRETPEIVLLDVNMPELPGDEVCRQVRERFPARPPFVLLFSSLGDEELGRVAKEAGADGFVSKQRGIDEIVPYLDWLFAQLRR